MMHFRHKTRRSNEMRVIWDWKRIIKEAICLWQVNMQKEVLHLTTIWFERQISGPNRVRNDKMSKNVENTSGR